MLDDVLREVDTTPRRRSSWMARRIPVMSYIVRTGLAATVVVVVALIGFALLGGGVRVGGGLTASPSTVSPSSVALSPAPSVAGAAPITGLPREGAKPSDTSPG